MDEDSDKYIMPQIGPANNGEPILRNQARILFNPIAVRGNESSGSRQFWASGRSLLMIDSSIT
jgi:hypothetical protein